VTRLEAAAHAARLKRSEATVWRWAKAGCNFDDPESVRAFVIRAECRKTNVQRHRERHFSGILEQSSPISSKSQHTRIRRHSGTSRWVSKYGAYIFDLTKEG